MEIIVIMVIMVSISSNPIPPLCEAFHHKNYAIHTNYTNYTIHQNHTNCIL